MGSGDGSEGEYRSPAHDDFDSEAYIDAADRLERAMDTQIQILEGIDNKAEHVTRLIALLLGILFSVISFITQLRQTPFAPPPSAVLVPFGIGVGSLLFSMGAAIVTYLSSHYKIGLDDDVGQFLSDASVSRTYLNTSGTFSAPTPSSSVRTNRLSRPTSSGSDSRCCSSSMGYRSSPYQDSCTSVTSENRSL